MIRYIIAAALATGTVLHPEPAPAQGVEAPVPLEDESIRGEYRAIDASVVRLRTVAELEYGTPDPESGLRAMLKQPLSVYGTGVVIGQIFTSGRWEYLVLTNHHVADASNYVIHDGRFLRENKRNTRAVPTVPEETYIVFSDSDEVQEEDIRLIEIARNVRGDMALLRTVGADRELVPFTGRIGYREGEVRPGAAVITSGFPYSGGKITALGTVEEIDLPHELGQPHEDYTVDLPVERGQSGSPVFMVETVETGGEPRVHFTLIGLLHANEHGKKYMVPFSLWQESLVGVREQLAGQLAR